MKRSNSNFHLPSNWKCLHLPRDRAPLPFPIARYSMVERTNRKKKLICLTTAPNPQDGLRWRALTRTHCFPSSQGPNPTQPRNPKINNSRQGMPPCCCHCQDLVHTSLMLLLLPREKLQIDPQDLTPCSHTSPGLPLLLLSISNG